MLCCFAKHGAVYHVKAYRNLKVPLNSSLKTLSMLISQEEIFCWKPFHRVWNGNLEGFLNYWSFEETDGTSLTGKTSCHLECIFSYDVSFCDPLKTTLKSLFNPHQIDTIRSHIGVSKVILSSHPGIWLTADTRQTATVPVYIEVVIFIQGQLHSSLYITLTLFHLDTLFFYFMTF